jgi:hypothetical protein
MKLLGFAYLVTTKKYLPLIGKNNKTIAGPADSGILPNKPFKDSQ